MSNDLDFHATPFFQSMAARVQAGEDLAQTYNLPTTSHEFERATSEAVRKLSRKTGKTLAVNHASDSAKPFELHNLDLESDEPIAAFDSEEALRAYVLELTSL